MEYVKSFRELEVYKSSRQLSTQIFEISKKFPRAERYSMADQIWGSSRSIGAQIAEAWGKRKYKNHFISKLTDSDAEQLETQHWIEKALSCSYISNEESEILLNECAVIGKMLNSMVQKAESFCKTPSIHEPMIDY